MRPTPRPALALGLALGVVGVAGACNGNRAGHGAADEPPATAEEPAVRAEPEDTARGVVAVVGADPATMVVVRTAAGPVTLSGPVADTLRAVAGIEVRVTGVRRADGSLEAASFRVRSADGRPAADGVLEVDGDMAILTGPDGERVRYAPAPPALRGMAGQRVWIAGQPGGAPESWGLIGGR